MLFAPPGRIGTRVDTWKVPVASVVRQPPTTRLSTAGTRVLIPLPVNPLKPVQAAPVSQLTGVVLVPTSEVIAIGCEARKPDPVRVRVDHTVPDVAAVRAPLDPCVDRDTVGLAACTGEAGSRKTIPAIPARNSSPIVPKEASLLFGVICICILFTYFRNIPLPNYTI